MEEPASRKQGPSNNEKDKKDKNNDRSNGKKKRRCGNGKSDEDKQFFCLIHGKNPTHNSDQCCILQEDAKRHKEERKKSSAKNGTKNPHASKDELHAIVEFAKQAMKLANAKNKKEELNNFDDLSVSTITMHSE